jgi:hypothetical protein
MEVLRRPIDTSQPESATACTAARAVAGLSVGAGICLSGLFNRGA